MTNAKFDLLEKIDMEKEKYAKYFENKEFEINKRGIENIRESMIKQLNEHKNSLELYWEKRINLVPEIRLFAVSKISLTSM
jgi:hypothetical protein